MSVSLSTQRSTKRQLTLLLTVSRRGSIGATALTVVVVGAAVGVAVVVGTILSSGNGTCMC